MEPMDATAIVGLGNPGRRYAANRHNLGFKVLEELCRRWGVAPRPGKGPYDIADAEFEEVGSPVVLIAPTTFMNGSGVAVQDVVVRYRVPLSRLLIVMDDFWLPLGRLRFRSKGSDGGHNGLASVLQILGTEDVPRLRLGIGRADMPPKALMAEFVLSDFAADEREHARAMVVRAGDAVEEFIHRGFTIPKNPIDTQEPTDTNT
jgi:PTH1 family peptidyl-tRNA hydrolase